MKEITLEELLEAGCHFGHQVTRQNPKARDFIFEARDNIHVIDLAKTKEGLEDAGKFVLEVAKKGGTMMVVGTKRQAQGIVREETKRAISGEKQETPSIFYVTIRWIGGTFTNSQEVAKNYKKLKDLTDNLRNDEVKAKYTKKEIGQWDKERQKLENFYGGMSAMKTLPDAIFIIDTHLEHLAVNEARAMSVPIVGIVDTNADPEFIDYPIPANDDAVGSIKLITKYIMDAWMEGSELKGKELEKNKEIEEKRAKAEMVKSKENSEEIKKEQKKKEVKEKKTKVKTEKTDK